MAKKTKKSKLTIQDDPLMDFMPVFDPRSRMLTSMISMGWRMAVMIMVPIIIGLKLDERYGTKPSWVLSGFFFGLAGSAYLIYNEYKEINIEMDKLVNSAKNTPKKAKKRNNR